MKRLLKPLLLASFIGASTLSANQAYKNYDDEFAKINRYFNSMIESHLNGSALNNISYPRVNVQDKKGAYIYEFDLAGVPKENIKLSIDENNLLTLDGKKESSSKNKKDGYVKQEIFYGSFKRVIQLPENIDQAKLSTKYDNGILKVTIPKKAVKKVKSKYIPIN